MGFTYAYYPQYDTDHLIEDAVPPNVEDIEKLFDSSTILHQYLKVKKYRMNGKFYNSKNPTGAISILERKEMSNNNWLRWDYVQLLLNLFFGMDYMITKFQSYQLQCIIIVS